MNQELIEKVKAAIGDDKPTDYKITPTKFPDELTTSAPELAEILKHSSFNEIAERYELHDKSAISTQRKFKSYAFQVTLGIFFATISGSLLAGLSTLIIESESIKRIILFFFGLVSTIGGGLAAFRIYQIKFQKILEEWMTERAKAETERLGYFNSLARHLVNKYNENIELKLHFVCMFKRYQIEVQRLYYSTSSREHKKSLEKTTTIGAIAALILATSSGIFGILGAFDFKFLPIAAIGTIGTAISILATRREELNQDERNSERYSRTAESLSKIVEKHDDVLQEIVKGDKEDIMIKYVDAVNDLLSLEHRQWINDISEMSAALENFEKSLTDIKKG